MSDKITWWPEKIARDIAIPTLVLMRYDWPDGKRIYEIGLFVPGKVRRWTDGHGGVLQTPDYFVPADQIVQFIHIPADREYTYNIKKPV